MKPLNYFRVLICLSLIVVTSLSHASFKKNLWTLWVPTNPLSTETISHDEWQTFLDKHVTTDDEGINVIDYQHLSKTDINELNQYLNRLSDIKITTYNRQEQLAYWLNLYNALTVRTIASYYPIDSIQDINISPGIFSIGPWGAYLITINNTPMTLDEIHNRIIRPIWNDNRTHYAINNATIGAPNLNRTAFNGRNIEEQLNEAAKQYINTHRGVQIIAGKLMVSKLYRWYVEDFGENDEGIIRHLNQFGDDKLKNDLKHIQHIENYIYNWHLNQAPTTD